MMRSWISSVSVVLVACALGAADARAAEEKKAPDPAKIFAKKDANSDGALTLDEFKTGLKDKALETADKRFKKIDSNSDGKVTLEEFKAGVPAKK